MKILVTGANGYIGKRLIANLLILGHEVYALVRDPSRFDSSKFLDSRINYIYELKDIIQEYQESSTQKIDQLKVIKGDLLEADTLKSLPDDIEVAFYLVHSMSTKNRNDFVDMEALCARNFLEAVESTKCKQVIYLSGISNSDELSKHLSSRRNVECILGEGNFALTILRAAIIIGSGSASFEIIRDLVEKIPVMITPRWLDTKCQPISVRNVIQYLIGVMLKEESYNRIFDIGGPDVLTYKQMLLGYANVRGLKRYIYILPVMTARISSYWLNFITSTNYALARTLVSSLRNEVICKNLGIDKIVPLKSYDYEESILRALYQVSQDLVLSSWKEAYNSKSNLAVTDIVKVEVPKYGCLFDKQELEFDRNPKEVKENIWSIGGTRGWYYWDWAWIIRGSLDSIFGGVGLRRGRREDLNLKPGDAVDFWRVIKADEDESHLVLYAEMKLPGEAWLEFKINGLPNGKFKLIQTATFRPKGLWGRIYWYLMVPAHIFIFRGMARGIVSHCERNVVKRSNPVE